MFLCERIYLEIADEAAGVLAQRAMVDDIATRLEQQQVVKGLQKRATSFTHVAADNLHALAFQADFKP